MDLQIPESVILEVPRKMTTTTTPNMTATTKAEANSMETRVAEASRVQNMRQIVWSQFKEHKMALVGLVVIIFMISIAVFAPLITSVTKIDPNAQNPLNRYLPMGSKVSVGASQRETAIDQYIQIHPEAAKAVGEEILAKQLVTAGKAEDVLYDLAKRDPKEIQDILSKVTTKEKTGILAVTKEFETYHIFGTDELGRDVFIRLVWGTRVSIGVGILVACAAAFIGLLIGSLAGFYGGWLDIILMRLTDSLLSLPQLPILIVVSAVSLEKLADLFPFLKLFINPVNESIVKLVFVVVLFSWMQVARLVRASVLSLKEREFILAARTLGATDATIIVKHLFPNVLAPLLVSVTLGVGSSIQTEAALSFLGLGIQQPTPSWGNMLFNALEIMQESPALIIIPGILILAATISFNYLGDGLQDAIDPKAIRR